MFKILFSKRFIIHVLIGIVVVLGIVGGAYYYLLVYTRQDETMELIDLEGFDIVEAEIHLEGHEIRPRGD